MRHMRFHTDERPFSCDVCHRHFHTNEHLKAHYVIHTSDVKMCYSKRGQRKMHICPYCSYSSNQKTNLRRHLRGHTGERRFQCGMCGKGFTEKHNLQAHIVIHTGESPFKCDVCNRGFGIKSRLTAHMITHLRVALSSIKAGQLKLHRCLYCSYYSNKKANLTRHLLCHTGERPYQCNVCGKGFTEKQYLQAHIFIHTGELPYRCKLYIALSTLMSEGIKWHKCSLCSYKSLQKSNLIRHQRKHTGERPFRCEVCGKGLASKQYLKVHYSAHSGELPFECIEISAVIKDGFKWHRCPHCEYESHKRANVVRHLRCHTGERLFSCEVCGKGLSSKQYMKIHLLTHTGELPFECKVCSKGFRTAQRLSTHMFIHDTNYHKYASNYDI
nr:gastrula zinc finger protein XlCGF8.2DB-like [Parasteatoda tepidariorum]